MAVPPSSFPDFPPPPSPTSVAVWTGQIRTLIAIAGGFGLGGAAITHITSQQISDEVTAFMTVFGFLAWLVAGLWSRYSKWTAAKQDHATSVAAAVATANTLIRNGVSTPVIVVPAPTARSPSATTTVAVTPQDVAASQAIIESPTGRM